jgi:twitching motility protein PilT
VRDWRELVTASAAQKASDVFWKVGNNPHIRLRGEVEKVDDWPEITPEFTEELARELMTDRQWERFEDFPERDLGLTIPDVCRLRINIYRERGAIGLVMRVIPLQIATIEELELPAVLNDMSMTPQGLILVTGPTGCGKSTTLAAMIDVINMRRQTNIVTIEDPIEYVHQDKKSIVNQRAVGLDTQSFTDALTHIVRQSPDVILIGEMRDTETMTVAMQAAETGHLVFSTVHTTSAAETMARIINMFPPYDKPQICMRLSKTLKGCLSQALVPRCDQPGRVAAVEIMAVTPTIEKLIEEGKPGEVYSSIQQGGYWGMQTMNQALLKLHQAGTISPAHALFNAGNYTEMRQMLRRLDPAAAEEAVRGQPGLIRVRSEAAEEPEEAEPERQPAGTAHPAGAQEEEGGRRPVRRRPSPRAAGAPRSSR